jgi:hypothetical protein
MSVGNCHSERSEESRSEESRSEESLQSEGETLRCAQGDKYAEARELEGRISENVITLLTEIE